MKKPNFFLFAACLLLSVGCQSDFFKKKPILFANYYVRYLQDGAQTRAEVSFFEGDSIKTAQPKEFSSVFFQKGAMELRRISARTLRYESETNDSYSPDYSFRYKRISSQSEEESQLLKMSPLRIFSVDSGLVSKKKGLKLSWADDALGEQEGLILLFTDKNGATAEVALAGPTPLASAKIATGNYLQDFAVGAGAQLALVKKQLRRGQEPKKQWVTTVEFYSQPIPIAIVE